MGLKTFDFFQKIAMDNVTKPTMIGSFLSIIAISIMIFLFIRQLIGFYSFHTKIDSVVFQPRNSDEEIPINVQIYFNNAPCNLLSLDLVDSMGGHRADISDTITKYKFNPITKRLDKYTPDNSLNALVNAIKANEGCALIGEIKVNQVPGEFHISFHNYRSLWKELNNKYWDLASKVKLTHSIKRLSLGEASYRTVKKYNLNPELFFREFDDDNTFKDMQRLNYNYFVKVIPYILINENWGSPDYAYSFSLSSKSSPFYPARDDMPIVNVKYEFSPIFMKVTHLKRDYLHFLTHVSAIVGGIFVVFSILNRILTNFMESSDK